MMEMGFAFTIPGSSAAMRNTGYQEDASAALANNARLVASNTD